MKEDLFLHGIPSGRSRRAESLALLVQAQTLELEDLDSLEEDFGGVVLAGGFDGD